MEEEIFDSEARVQSQSVIWYNNTYQIKGEGMIFAIPNEGARLSTKFLIGKLTEALKNPSTIGSIIGTILNYCKKGDPIAGNKAKALGVRAGVSDVMINHKKIWHCVEFKVPGGVQSDQQKNFETKILALGTSYNLIYSVEEFKELVMSWG